MIEPTQPDGDTSSQKIGTGRKLGYGIVGLLALSVLVIAFVQPLIFGMMPSPLAYGSAQTDAKGNPQEDKRGAFLMLFPTPDIRFPSTLVELLATNRPGVVDEAAGAHLFPDEIAGILVQTASVGEPADYRVYRTDAATQEIMRFARQPGGKRIILSRESGEWEPGRYIIDVPSEGMFGGRTFFHFYVDARPDGGNN